MCKVPYNCENCGEEVKVIYGSGRFCCQSCSNKRNPSEDTKRKIRKSVSKYIEKIRVTKKVICKQCNKEFEVPDNYRNKKRQFCSELCSHRFFASSAGKKSAESQSINRRSKNEIYFSELCRNKFIDILTNETMFNGWDADIIIPELKVAILWNGKWHYEKITKKHSVLQVQNRDEIKINEIINCGYIPYTIKDMGRENKEFVENEFEKFIKIYCGVEKLVILRES